jgi:hypothetical protein
MAALELADAHRQAVGEALLVYVFRALDKPNRETYFHVNLLEALLRGARISMHASQALTWACGTNYLKQFDHRSAIDQHPDAPPAAVSSVYSGNSVFVILSKSALERIRSMTIEKRRQLEALAASLFPDVEAVRGPGEMFAGARFDANDDAFLVPEGQQTLDQLKAAKSVGRAETDLKRLQTALSEVLQDPELPLSDKERVAKELEDLIIGRLEMEQPLINVELLSRVLQRSLQRLAGMTVSAGVDQLVQRVVVMLAPIFPFWKFGATG